MLGSCWVAAQLTASQEGHSSMKLESLFLMEVSAWSFRSTICGFSNYNLWIFSSSHSMCCALITGDCHRCHRWSLSEISDILFPCSLMALLTLHSLAPGVCIACFDVGSAYCFSLPFCFLFCNIVLAIYILLQMSQLLASLWILLINSSRRSALYAPIILRHFDWTNFISIFSSDNPGSLVQQKYIHRIWLAALFPIIVLYVAPLKSFHLNALSRMPPFNAIVSLHLLRSCSTSLTLLVSIFLYTFSVHLT
jgi:hypothetical protein